MSALALKALAVANAAGVAITLDGDGLILDPMPSAELVAQLKAVKPDLLRVLAGREAARSIVNTSAPPPDCSEPRWEVARRGLRRFMKDGWGDQAALLGCTVEELYRIPRVWGRVDLCGAALLVGDRRVVAITEATIVIEGLSGSRLKFRRAGREHIAEDEKAQVKAHVDAKAVGPTLFEPDKASPVLTSPGRGLGMSGVPAAERADNAAFIPLCIPARPESARLEASAEKPFAFYEFFCGSGMAREGLGANWACTFANDIDAAKARSYVANFGCDGLKLGDVAHLTTADLPGAAALAWASSPCQDVSLAGDRAGLDGARSGAFWPFMNLIRGLRAEGRAPRMIVIENVIGLITSHGGKDFDAICEALTGARYRLGVVMIDAALFVPQSRERVFVVAVDDTIAIPPGVVTASPTAPFHSSALIAASRRNPQYEPIWWRLPTPAAAQHRVRRHYRRRADQSSLAQPWRDRPVARDDGSIAPR
jgi:site-specific DNA-cytosine methylase